VKKVFVILALVLILASPIVVSAMAPRTLTVFHADGFRIGFHPTRVIQTHLFDAGFTAAEFRAYVDHARSQWARAGIHTSFVEGEPPSCVIMIFGGTRAELERREIALVNRYAVALVTGTWVGDHTVANAGFNVRNYRIETARVWVPRQHWWELWWHADYYRHAFTHELGHALGWFDHSRNSQDVMYERPGRRPELTTRDIEHLKQNY